MNRSTQGGLMFAGALALATLLAGCAPEGTGSVEIDKSPADRAKEEISKAAEGPLTPKQAQALKAQEEAAKAHPKLN